MLFVQCGWLPSGCPGMATPGGLRVTGERRPTGTARGGWNWEPAPPYPPHRVKIQRGGKGGRSFPVR